MCTGGNGAILLMRCNLMQLIRFAYCKGQYSQFSIEYHLQKNIVPVLQRKLGCYGALIEFLNQLIFVISSGIFKPFQISVANSTIDGPWECFIIHYNDQISLQT